MPDGWIWTALSDACYIELGQSPPSSTYNTDGIGLPFFQGKAEFGDLYPTAVKWCSEPKKIAEDGDVLISVRAPVGSTNLNREKSCIGRGLAAIRPNDDMSNLYFLYLLRYIQQELIDQATGTTFQAISGKVLREQKIPLAPPVEQHQIVAEIEKQFTRLDQAVASLQRLQSNLARYKASVLKAACEGRLVPQDPNNEPATDLLARVLAERRAQWEAANPKKKYKEPVGVKTAVLPDLPEGWVWARVDQLGEVRLGRQRSPKNHQGPHMHPYLRAANATWEGVDLSDVMEMNFSPKELEIYRLKQDDILLAEASGSANEVGKPFIWNEQISDCCFQNTLIRVRLSNMPPNYLYLHFLKDAQTGRLGEIAKGVGIHHLGANRLAEMPVAIPPLAEQERIVAEVERRLSVVAATEQTITANLARAERLRQSILHRAFTGQLVPQQPA
ncbi:MAG: restriction endonuclease subunit S [Anaerolineales bacterium]|nr:restriction endonuclease subunit S [Anaerolineales bacterium]